MTTPEDDQEQFALFSVGAEGPTDLVVPEVLTVPAASEPELVDETASQDAASDAESPEVTPEGDRPWELLPVGTAADGHALIATAEATYTPSGQRLTGPVDSIEKLDALLRWADLSPQGVTAQVWFVGIESVAALGWEIDPGDEADYDDMETLRKNTVDTLEKTITATLPPLLASGWELRGSPGFVIHLKREHGTSTQMVDLFLEPYSWTYWNRDFGWGNRVGDLSILGNPTSGTYLPDEDHAAARELGRRLDFAVEHLGTLPGPTPARTGAAMVDKIRRERKRSGKGLAVNAAGPVPPIEGAPRGDLEPAAGWARTLDADDLREANQLVTIDQRAAYLASAGMLDFGFGKCENVIGPAALDEAMADKPRFGIWRVTLPAGASYALPEKLPLPHPAMLMDKPVQTWVTTVSLEGLCAPIADGGMGLDLLDLEITEAWLFTEKGRALDKWAKLLRQARTVAVDTGDLAMKRFVGAVYKGYVGRMTNADLWTAPSVQHHHQPIWRAAIMGHARWRGRRVAMRIARETGRWPIRTTTDSWVYLIGADERVDDDSAALGKMQLEKHRTLTDEMTGQLAAAQTPHEVRAVIGEIYGTEGQEED